MYYNVIVGQNINNALLSTYRPHLWRTFAIRSWVFVAILDVLSTTVQVHLPEKCYSALFFVGFMKKHNFHDDEGVTLAKSKF